MINPGIERLYWLARLRWIAVAGVVLTVFLATCLFKFPLPIFPLVAVSATLAAYNLIFVVLLANVKIKASNPAINRIANLQISLDLFCLAVLLHFSGGIENPFLFYFIFHMIIAGILLSRRAAFLQASFAILLFCLMVALEYSGGLAHYPLSGFIINSQYRNPAYISGTSFVFISTLYIAVYMAASISFRIRQREKILKETNSRLEEKDRIKSEYVLHVSHDIKEHLAAIQGCLEPVAGGITGELNPQQLDLVQRATRRTAKLMFFVKALLGITRIRLNKEIKMENFDFRDALSEAMASVASKAGEKNIALDSKIEPGVKNIRAAKEYIQETLTNLLANAVKYTPRNGKVNALVEDKGNNIVVKIFDNGIGIPQAELSRIFEEFYRASNAKEVERDGTGLGLSIARQIVELHNGKIRVESEEGKGSTFIIELPK